MGTQNETSFRKIPRGPFKVAQNKLSKTLCNRFIERVLAAKDSPLASDLFIKYTTGDHVGLLNTEFDYASYTSVDDFRSDYLIFNYLRKSPVLKTDIDTRKVALQHFENAEVECFLTNSRLKYRRPSDDGVEEIMFIAQRKISTLLGEFNYEKLQEGCAWGPGSTYSLKGASQIHAHNKVCEDPISTTPTAWLHFCQAISKDYHWLAANKIVTSDLFDSNQFDTDIHPTGCVSAYSYKTCNTLVFPILSKAQFVLGSEVSTVPKNAKTDRTILIEPSANIFLQKGVGSYIRDRLLRVGINLNDQSANQKAAGRAYSEGLMTIDLSAASDTISSELVWRLIPIEYANYMDDIRSQTYTHDRSTFSRFQKWSSMGNGYTFELESLIFWALTSATTEYVADSQGYNDIQRVLVYGDDIIADRRIFSKLDSTFSYCGFKINKEKSFVDGNFFESCGKHFFKGVDVTPIYLRNTCSLLPEVMLTYNALLRWSNYIHQEEDLIEKTFSKALTELIKGVNQLGLSKYTFVVPVNCEQNDGFATNWSEIRKEFKPNCNGSYNLPVLRQIAVHLDLTDHTGLYAYKMRLRVREAFNGRVGLRLPGTYSVCRRIYLVG